MFLPHLIKKILRIGIWYYIVCMPPRQAVKKKGSKKHEGDGNISF